MTEADGSAQPMYPQEARIRNLTYVILAVIPRFWIIWFDFIS